MLLNILILPGDGIGTEVTCEAVRVLETALACAKAGRYEFMFSLCPLILERGTASPVNPIAIL